MWVDVEVKPHVDDEGLWCSTVSCSMELRLVVSWWTASAGAPTQRFCACHACGLRHVIAPCLAACMQPAGPWVRRCHRPGRVHVRAPSETALVPPHAAPAEAYAALLQGHDHLLQVVQRQVDVPGGAGIKGRGRGARSTCGM